MPTHESHQNALRQRDALAREVLDLRRKIADLCKPDAELDLAALVAEVGILRGEVQRLKGSIEKPPFDAKEGKAWRCRECPSWATLAENAHAHRLATGHGKPYYDDQPAAATSDNSQGFRQPPPKPPECNCPEAITGVTDEPCPVHGSFPRASHPPRSPCPVPSSITGAACLLEDGHPSDGPLRFHRYPPKDAK